MLGNNEQPLEQSGSCRVSVRVPPFYPEESALWFKQIEGQFKLSSITADATKFNYVASQLEPQYAERSKIVFTTHPLVIDTKNQN